jgi:hypothetical protein
MKQHITPEQLLELPPEAQSVIREWYFDTVIKFDDTIVHVCIPEEGNSTYVGRWDHEYHFDYPEEYVGKLKNHQGTMIPLLTIGELIWFIDERRCYAQISTGWDVATRHLDPEMELFAARGTELIDTLWKVVKSTLQMV